MPKKESFLGKNGKAAELTLHSEKQVGKGGFGEVHQVKGAHVEDARVRTRSYVVKTFLEGTWGSSGKVNAQRAVANYEAAKKAGLKVLPTYRLSADGGKILMTDLNKLCDRVLSNNGSSLGIEKIEKVHDFSIFVKNVFLEAVKAAEGKPIVEVGSDAYFYLAKEKSGETSLDFVIGDMDCVFERNEPEIVLTPEDVQSKIAAFLMDKLGADTTDLFAGTKNLTPVESKGIRAETLRFNVDNAKLSLDSLVSKYFAGEAYASGGEEVLCLYRHFYKEYGFPSPSKEIDCLPSDLKHFYNGKW